MNTYAIFCVIGHIMSIIGGELNRVAGY